MRSHHNLAAMFRFDLLSLRGFSRVGVLLVALAVINAIVAPGGQTAVVMLAVMTVIIVLIPFANDERYQPWLLLGTLPIARRTVVLSRYGIVVGGLVAMAAFLTALLAATGQLARDPLAVTSVLSTAMGIGLLLAIEIPLIVRFGYTKAMWTILVLVMAIAGALAMDLLAAPPLDAVGGGLTPGGLIAGGLAAVAVALTASYLISARVVERKDF